MESIHIVFLHLDPMAGVIALVEWLTMSTSKSKVSSLVEPISRTDFAGWWSEELS